MGNMTTDGFAEPEQLNTFPGSRLPVIGNRRVILAILAADGAPLRSGCCAVQPVNRLWR